MLLTLVKCVVVGIGLKTYLQIVTPYIVGQVGSNCVGHHG